MRNPSLFRLVSMSLATALLVAGVACIRPEGATRGSLEPDGPGVTQAAEETGSLPLESAEESAESAIGGPGAHEGAEGAPSQATHRFQDAEGWAQRFESPERLEWQKPEEVVALLGVSPGMVVADIGAGTGFFLTYLSRAAGETGKVLALDVEETMVRYMDERVEREELFNVKPRLVAPDDPTLPEGGVDRVLIVNTWHHIADRSDYAAKLAPGLAPGGAVFIVDFTEESPVGPAKADRLAPERVIAELESAGLDASVVPEDLPHQYVVVGRRR